MVGPSPNREESTGSQCQDHFLNLERRRDQVASVHTTHTSRSHPRGGSHVSYEENARVMQLKIDHLKRKLRCEQWRWTPTNSDVSSGDEGDGSYRPRSRTPLSESFSCNEDCHHERRSKSLSHKGLGNDAISKAINQISKLPFTRIIEGGKLPRLFTQPTFTIYNGRTVTPWPNFIVNLCVQVVNYYLNHLLSKINIRVFNTHIIL